MLAAVGLAVSEGPDTSRVRPQAGRRPVVKEVSGYLGNTPAVARASYIDPRVIRHYEKGLTIAPVLAELGRARTSATWPPEAAPKAAVLKLLAVPAQPRTRS